nr:PREDICTED: uncharacterized protein LOC109039182 isoform X2 [Bemisia tabaci]XP_018910111.1 PREDICTED: uncharacterized protein LOC109039182 isoform X2 [Bemisia tabaci]
MAHSLHLLGFPPRKVRSRKNKENMESTDSPESTEMESTKGTESTKKTRRTKSTKGKKRTRSTKTKSTESKKPKSTRSTKTKSTKITKTKKNTKTPKIKKSARNTRLPRISKSTESTKISKTTEVIGSTEILTTTRHETTRSRPKIISPFDAIFRENEIVPQIVNNTPIYKCEVEYGKEKIHFGNNMTADQIAEKPTLIKWPTQSGAFYTLLMFGPDVPTREKSCEMMWRHWAVGNIPKNDIDKGDTLVEYENIEPFYRAGFHRILFFIYKQPGRRRLNFTSSKGVIKKGSKWEVRGVWYIERFLAKFNLTEPIAANFFFLYDLNPHPEIPHVTVDPLSLIR